MDNQMSEAEIIQSKMNEIDEEDEIKKKYRQKVISFFKHNPELARSIREKDLKKIRQIIPTTSQNDYSLSIHANLIYKVNSTCLQISYNELENIKTDPDMKKYEKGLTEYLKRFEEFEKIKEYHNTLITIFDRTITKKRKIPEFAYQQLMEKYPMEKNGWGKPVKIINLRKELREVTAKAERIYLHVLDQTTVTNPISQEDEETGELEGTTV